MSFDTEAAGEFMLRILKRHGAMTGEYLTNCAKGAGFVPHDDRAFGPVIARLVRERLIKCVGYRCRLKGNGTAGARLWAATSTPATAMQIHLHPRLRSAA